MFKHYKFENYLMDNDNIKDKISKSIITIKYN